MGQSAVADKIVFSLECTRDSNPILVGLLVFPLRLSSFLRLAFSFLKTRGGCKLTLALLAIELDK